MHQRWNHRADEYFTAFGSGFRQRAPGNVHDLLSNLSLPQDVQSVWWQGFCFLWWSLTVQLTCVMWRHSHAPATCRAHTTHIQYFTHFYTPTHLTLYPVITPGQASAFKIKIEALWLLFPGIGVSCFRDFLILPSTGPPATTLEYRDCLYNPAAFSLYKVNLPWEQFFQ